MKPIGNLRQQVIDQVRAMQGNGRIRLPMAAIYLGVGETTLERWHADGVRVDGKGKRTQPPRRYKSGQHKNSSVYYRRNSLVNWLEKHQGVIAQGEKMGFMVDGAGRVTLEEFDYNAPNAHVDTLHDLIFEWEFADSEALSRAVSAYESVLNEQIAAAGAVLKAKRLREALEK